MKHIAVAALLATALPNVAAACGPMWYGRAQIDDTGAPACLTFETPRMLGDWLYRVEIVAINDCDGDIILTCPERDGCDDGDTGLEGADLPVLAGTTRSIFVTGQGNDDWSAIERLPPLGWRSGEQSGTIDYTIIDEGHGVCEHPVLCRASPGTGGGPAWWGMGLLALLGLRRLLRTHRCATLESP